MLNPLPPDPPRWCPGVTASDASFPPITHSFRFCSPSHGLRRAVLRPLPSSLLITTSRFCDRMTHEQKKMLLYLQQAGVCAPTCLLRVQREGESNLCLTAPVLTRRYMLMLKCSINGGLEGRKPLRFTLRADTTLINSGALFGRPPGDPFRAAELRRQTTGPDL